MTPKMVFWKVRARIATMFARLLPDDVYLKWIFPARVGYPLDLKNPKTFNEKLQWLKLHDRKPEYTKMVDKIEAKKYVASIIGEEYIIPTIGVYNSVDEIDFDTLPRQFVLKCSHDSGGIVICRDKNKLDKKAAIEKLRKGLKQNFYWQNREWPYKNVRPRIIAEQYMEDTWKPNASLVDYKFYCFGGEPTYCQVIQDRDTTETIDFFDMDWQHQDFVGLNPAAGPATLCPQKPKNFDVMKKIAGDLSKEKPFSRIDLYEINDHTFFGEITFFPLSGFGVFSPEQYNEILGKLITMTGTEGGKFVIKISEGDPYSIEYEKVEGELKDYKFFCFDGKPLFLFVATDRGKKDVETKFDFFDMEWNHLPFTNGHPNSNILPKKPQNFEKMKQLAAMLAKGKTEVRVDLYNVDGRIYFGELTFTHWSGLVPFEPSEWDSKLGEWLKLPNETGGGKILISSRLTKPVGGHNPKGLLDYKFYCFDGEAKFLYISKGLENHATANISFLSLDWQEEKFSRSDFKPFACIPPKPSQLDTMIMIANRLSENHAFLRVDLYQIGECVYFSELTFSPCSGTMLFNPKEWDLKIGKLMTLPQIETVDEQ